jgi:hypothetical protein
VSVVVTVMGGGRLVRSRGVRGSFCLGRRGEETNREVVWVYRFSFFGSASNCTYLELVSDVRHCSPRFVWLGL